MFVLLLVSAFVVLIFPNIITRKNSAPRNGREKKPSKRASTMKVRIIHQNCHKTVDLNRKIAIRQRCLNCSGWSTVEVELCQQTDCRLYKYRMNENNQNAKERNRDLRKYCLDCCNGSLGEVKKCPALDCPLYAFRKTGVDHSIKIKPESCRGHIGAFSQTVLL